jgi:hypothetical protein
MTILGEIFSSRCGKLHSDEGGIDDIRSDNVNEKLTIVRFKEISLKFV